MISTHKFRAAYLLLPSPAAQTLGGGSASALHPLALCSVPLALVIGAGEEGKGL